MYDEVRMGAHAASRELLGSCRFDSGRLASLRAVARRRYGLHLLSRRIEDQF
jgi:hypothetical protein